MAGSKALFGFLPMLIHDHELGDCCTFHVNQCNDLVISGISVCGILI